jgi:hypothetical protein
VCVYNESQSLKVMIIAVVVFILVRTVASNSDRILIMSNRYSVCFFLFKFCLLDCWESDRQFLKKRVLGVHLLRK